MACNENGFINIFSVLNWSLNGIGQSQKCKKKQSINIKIVYLLFISTNAFLCETWIASFYIWYVLETTTAT